MPITAAPALADWSNFYVITGAAAASLTGLMFVVITLIAGVGTSRNVREGMATFNTPTIVHFGSALLISVVVSAPLRSPATVGWILGLAAFAAILYTLRVMYGLRALHIYRADAEDWITHGILPLVAYGALLAGSLMLAADPASAQLAIAGAAVLLIFIGIRNAWDIVTYITIDTVEERGRPQD